MSFDIAGQREIQHRDPAARAAERVPERLALQVLAGVAAVEIVGAGPQLHEAVDAVICRVGARIERRPGGADEEAVHAVGVADETLAQQPREDRQRAVACPVLHQHLVARIHLEKQHAGGRRHECFTVAEPAGPPARRRTAEQMPSVGEIAPAARSRDAAQVGGPGAARLPSTGPRRPRRPRARPPTRFARSRRLTAAGSSRRARPRRRPGGRACSRASDPPRTDGPRSGPPSARRGNAMR